MTKKAKLPSPQTSPTNGDHPLLKPGLLQRPWSQAKGLLAPFDVLTQRDHKISQYLKIVIKSIKYLRHKRGIIIIIVVVVIIILSF